MQRSLPFRPLEPHYLVASFESIYVVATIIGSIESIQVEVKKTPNNRPNVCEKTDDES